MYFNDFDIRESTEDFILQYNEIFNNYGSRIFIGNINIDPYYNGSFCIKRNNIYNNSDYAIDCHWTEYSKNVSASNNWWGTSNSAEIDQMIFDYYDDFNYAKVLYTPFLSNKIIETYNAEPPQWSNLQINDTSIQVGDNINISIEVTDNVEISNIWIEINGTFTQYVYNMTKVDGTDTYFYIFTPTLALNYIYTIFMNDTSGHLNYCSNSFSFFFYFLTLLNRINNS